MITAARLGFRVLDFGFCSLGFRGLGGLFPCIFFFRRVGISQNQGLKGPMQVMDRGIQTLGLKA